MSQLGMPNRFHREEGSGARNRNERICLIVNPRAGAGAAGERLDKLKQAVDRAFEQWSIKVTEGPGHASALAAQAVDEGAQIVAAVGGDGTCHEVVGGLFDGDRVRSRKLAFTVIPFGTGSDLIRSLHIPKRLSKALWVAATGITLPTDVGFAEYTGPSGEPRRDVFINVAGLGVNGEVVRIANEMDKRWGGRITFLVATIRATMAYEPPVLHATWEGPDGAGSWDGPVLSCFIANGSWNGGGMWVGRGGNMQDGALDLTLLPPTRLLAQFMWAPKLYRGTLDEIPGAVRARVTHVRASVEGDAPARIDLDGEQPGCLPASFRVIPRALPVRGGWVHSPLLAPRAAG